MAEEGVTPMSALPNSRLLSTPGAHWEGEPELCVLSQSVTPADDEESLVFWKLGLFFFLFFCEKT